MKRFYALLPTLCVSILLFASYTSKDGIYYVFDSGSQTAAVTYQGTNVQSGYYSGSVEIPATVEYDGVEYTVTSVGDYAFANCKSLTAVSFAEPSNVVTIAPSAFRSCPKLTDISLPSSVTTIGDYAFYGCSALKWITLPENVISAGNGLFEYCTALQEVVFKSDAITSLGNYSFQFCENLTDITLPAGLLEISKSQFSMCGKLEHITIPANVKTIEEYAFRDCEALGSVDFAGTQLNNIGTDAFLGCESLTSLVLPEGLTAIDNYAFKGCKSLKSVTMSSTLATLGYGSFESDAAITDIYCNRNESAPRGADEAFNNVDCDKITVHIPCSSTTESIYREAWTRFNNFELNDFTSYILSLYPEDSEDNKIGYARILKSPTACDDASYLFEAVPKSGYIFSAWSDGNTNQQREMVLTKSTSLTARFRKIGDDTPTDPDQPIDPVGDVQHIVRHINNGEIIDTLEVAVGADIKSALDADKDNFVAKLSDAKYADIFNPACDMINTSTWTVFGGDWIPKKLTQDYLHVNINTKPALYHVRFYAKQMNNQGIVSDKLMWEADYACDDIITMPDNAPDAGCSSFTGNWLLNNSVIPSTTPFVLSDYVNANSGTDIRVDAQYEVVEHYVRYHLLETDFANNTVDVDGKADKYKDYFPCGTPITYREAESAPDGFQFLGWYTYPETKIMLNTDVHCFGAIVPNMFYALMVFNGSDLISYSTYPAGYDLSDKFAAANQQMQQIAETTGVEFGGWLIRSTGQVVPTIDKMPAYNLIIEAFWGEAPECNLTLVVKPAIESQGTVELTEAPSCTNPSALVAATAKEGYRFVAWSDGSTANPHRITDITKLATYANKKAVIIANFEPEEKPVIVSRSVEIGVNDADAGYVVATVHFEAEHKEGVTASWLTGEEGDEIKIELKNGSDIVRIADFKTEAQHENLPAQFRKISAGKCKINIAGQDGNQVDIFNQYGQVVYSGPARNGIRVPQAGQYIICIDKRLALIEVK